MSDQFDRNLFPQQPLGNRSTTEELLHEIKGMMLYPVTVNMQTNWTPDPIYINEHTQETSFGRVVHVCRSDNAVNLMHLCHPVSGEPIKFIDLRTVKKYTIRTQFWHEVITPDGRQMALNFSCDGLQRFCDNLEVKLRPLGVLDRLLPPTKFFKAKDLLDEHQKMKDGRPRPISVSSTYTDVHMPQPSPLHQSPIQLAMRPPRNKGQNYEKLKSRLPSSQILPAPQMMNGAISGRRSDAQRVWTCHWCTYINRDTVFACDSCQAERSDVWKCPGKCSRKYNLLNQYTCSSCGAWKCKKCIAINFRSSAACVACGRM